MAFDSISQLPPLLVTTPYLLAYVLPLLLLSLILTFSGTFLTLDRTRSFPPTSGSGATYAALPIPGGFTSKPKKTLASKWILEGGVGGLIGGYAFGVHLSTALALLIPATTPSSHLSPKSFLAVWLLSSIVTTFIAGRYRLAALLFLGISGGTLTALALCLITHPTLRSRIVLTAIFLSLFSLLVLIAGLIPRITYTFLHHILRICTASTGSFGVIVAVSLLMKPQEQGWANVWERLWMSDGEWGSGREQGLSAAWGIFFVAGMASDWALKRWIGECPDEKWDSYLASYTSNLPNQAGRAGSFRPPLSIWDRMFPASDHKREIIFPDETSPIPLPLPITMRGVPPEKLSYDKPLKSVLGNDLLKKRLKATKSKRGFAWRNLGGRKKRKPLKFGGEISSDSDLSDDEDRKAQGKDHGDGTKTSPTPTPKTMSPLAEPKQIELAFVPTKAKPPVLRSNSNSNSSSSTPTLVEPPLAQRGATLDHILKQNDEDARFDALRTLDYDKEIMLLRRQRGVLGADDEDLDYSDYEERTHSPITHVRREEGKRPATGGPGGGWSPAFLTRHQSQNENSKTGDGHTQVPPVLSLPGPVPVPATPSLLKALDRVAIAQRAAYGGPTSPLGRSQGQSQSMSPSPEAGKEGRKKSISNPTIQTAVRPSGTYEDAEAGLEKPTRPKRTNEGKAQRWEEFWREVRVKAQT